jgi:hypothetical protein
MSVEDIGRPASETIVAMTVVLSGFGFPFSQPVEQLYASEPWP